MNTRAKPKAQTQAQPSQPLISAEQLVDLLQNDELLTIFQGVVNKVIDKILAGVKEQLLERIEQNAGTILDLHSAVEQKRKEVDHLNVELTKQQDTIGRLDGELEELKQYSRRNNIRVFGSPESAGEITDDVVIDIMVKQLGVELRSSDIDRSHRVGKPGGPKARPIIVKLTSHKKKREILKEKKKLKKSKISVHEDLTRYRHSLLIATQKSDRVTTCWTMDGKVFANVPSTHGESVRRLIPNIDFLNSLPKLLQ